MNCKHTWICVADTTTRNYKDLSDGKVVRSAWCTRCGTLRFIRYRAETDYYGACLDEAEPSTWKYEYRRPSNRKLRK